MKVQFYFFLLTLLLLGALFQPAVAQRLPAPQQATAPPTKPPGSHNKDNPAARAEYEWLMLRDPATGTIPADIREQELRLAAARLNGQRTLAGGDWVARGPFSVGGRTRALAIDLSDENIILAGGVSGGMWRSEDGGATWSLTTALADLQYTVTCLAQAPRPGFRHIWYYGTGEDSGNSASAGGAFLTGRGLFKSEDGGKS